VEADEFAPFFRREFPRLVLHLLVRGFGVYAEDAAEEAMREAYEQWADINAPAGWVRTVAVRIAGRAAERDRRRLQTEDAYRQQQWDPEVPTPEIAFALREQQSDILAQLKGMPPVRRRVLALVFDGYKVKEIAHELQVTEATVRSHVRHLREALRTRDERAGGVT